MCNVLCNKYQRGEILFFSVSLSGYPWIKSPDWALWIPKRLHLRQTLKDASESGLCLSSCWVAWLQPCKTIFIFSILWTVNHCLVDWPEFESAFFFYLFTSHIIILCIILWLCMILHYWQKLRNYCHCHQVLASSIWFKFFQNQTIQLF